MASLASDGVGGNIKTQVEELMLRNHVEKEVIQIESVEEIKNKKNSLKPKPD